MIFQESKVKGAFEIDVECHHDERGFFARTWCQTEFSSQGLEPELVQCSISYNPRRGTLRGMHYQESPFAETKVVRCTRGAAYDVVIDLRPDSPTYKGWMAVVLTAEKRNMVYVPKGCAHGFLTMEDETEIFYQMSEFFRPEFARGVRWNDPAFAVVWPAVIEVISERDRTFPDFPKTQCLC